MDALTKAFSDDLTRAETLTADERQAAMERAGELVRADTARLAAVRDGILAFSPPKEGSQAEAIIAAYLEKLAHRFAADAAHPAPVEIDDVERIVKLYKHLRSPNSGRNHLLEILANWRNSASLPALAEILASDPPENWLSVATALAPLFKHRDFDAQLLFPALLDGLSQPGAAAVVLDFANYLTRQQRVPRHPAAERVDRLIKLLESVVAYLEKLSTQRPTETEAMKNLQRQAHEGMVLACSLCDALALVGEQRATRVLHHALGLGHRRIRCEAAAALARLGDDAGRDAIVELTAFPISRLRALSYAEELGILDRIAEEHKSPAGRAAAEITTWLAEPVRWGFPPSDLDLLESRKLYWPGYAEPIEAFLFLFTYHLPQGNFQNVGIVGPLTYSPTADITNWPIDDMYALFAGWQAESAEIREIEVKDFGPIEQNQFSQIARDLALEDYEDVLPVMAGRFFGEEVLVASARREGELGTVVVGSGSPQWFPVDIESPRPADSREVYSLWKGRRLLEAFNG